MLYVYQDNRLKPIKAPYAQAIDIARAKNAILVSNSIDEMIHIASYELSALLLHKKNSDSIFRYWYLQLKHLTLKEFKIILFASKHDTLYNMLKCASAFSMGKYKLLDFKGFKR